MTVVLDAHVGLRFADPTAAHPAIALSALGTQGQALQAPDYS